MQDIEHGEEELTKEEEVVVDRRKATRYPNQCCLFLCICLVHRANAMKENWRDLCVCVCVCVFHYDYFPVASFFLLLLLLPASSSSRRTQQPSSHMCLVSLSLSFVVSCCRMLNQNNKRTNWFFLVLFLFFCLFTHFLMFPSSIPCPHHLLESSGNSAFRYLRTILFITGVLWHQAKENIYINICIQN
jgi:hypothetical protein